MKNSYEPIENVSQLSRVKYTQTSLKYMQKYVKSKIKKLKKWTKGETNEENWNQKDMEENHKISEMKNKFQSPQGD